MTALLIEPHLDDAVLFATYTILNERPVVVTCLSETLQSPERNREHEQAMLALGVTEWAMLPNPEQKPDWGGVLAWLLQMRREFQPDRVFAPAVEEGGHEQHNRVGDLALEAFGDTAAITWYMTYRRGERRSRGSTEVAPSPGMAALKLRAMACYASQIEWEATRPWFAADDMLREWWA